MTCSLKYSVLPDLKVVIEYFEGVITLSDIIEHKKNIVNDKQYNLNYNSIIDFRNAQLLLSEDDLNDYINFVITKSKINGKRKVALLTSSPNHVVVLTMFDMLSKSLPMKYNIFSTMESSFEWIEISICYIDLIEKCIKKLKSDTTFHRRKKILLYNEYS